MSLENRVAEMMAGSALLRAVAGVRPDGGVRFALGDAPLRALHRSEVAQLEAQGNTAFDWGRVRVADGFNPIRVQRCRFHGDVVLGRFPGLHALAAGVDVPTGVYDCTLANCVVGADAYVQGVGLLANYVVGPGAVLRNCGTVSCEGETAFGNGQSVPVALEAGGREVELLAELDVDTAAAVARPGRAPEQVRRYREAAARYRLAAACGRGIVEAGARVVDTPKLVNTYVGPAAVIDGATLVADSTLLSTPEQPTRVEGGACVTRSLLQWGARVATLALVDRSLLGEHSCVERHGKLTDSVVGPNCGLGAGEVTSCLLGPFVAAHHQSLLISTLWPEGRGNVGYGAKVGSNHTSRAPDQECRAAEGMFFGLGVNVKFPADFSRSPYSVVACGATLPPQRVAFPFALLTPPAGDGPGANDLFPAWVLAENLYAVVRAEGKYRSRNKARRSRLDYRALRPDTVDLMRDARRRLEAVRQKKEFYTDRDVEGLGKNVLSEAARTAAVSAYRFFTEYYALTGLKDRAVQALAAAGPEAVRRLLHTPDADPRWEHQRGVLREELGCADVAAALEQLCPMLDEVAAKVERSRAKDDRRGERTIDDYADVHRPAACDPLVQEAWAQARRARAEAEAVIRALRGRQEVPLCAPVAVPAALVSC